LRKVTQKEVDCNNIFLSYRVYLFEENEAGANYSILFKFKEGSDFNPEEYLMYFED